MKKWRFTSFVAMVMACSLFFATCGGSDPANTGGNSGGEQPTGDQAQDLL